MIATVPQLHVKEAGCSYSFVPLNRSLLLWVYRVYGIFSRVQFCEGKVLENTNCTKVTNYIHHGRADFKVVVNYV